MHGLCCAISGTFPTYVAGILNSYHVIALSIARTSSTTAFDCLSKKNVTREQIGPFKLEFREENNEDFMHCEITLGDISLPFNIIIVDTTKECGPRSNLNYVEFLWNHMVLLQFKKYAIVAVPFEIPTIFYLKHYRATSEGWKTSLLCEICFDEYREILAPYISPSSGPSCRCTVCLRQPPSL
jgi:hypothetical protein